MSRRRNRNNASTNSNDRNRGVDIAPEDSAVDQVENPPARPPVGVASPVNSPPPVDPGAAIESALPEGKTITIDPAEQRPAPVENAPVAPNEVMTPPVARTPAFNVPRSERANADPGSPQPPMNADLPPIDEARRPGELSSVTRYETGVTALYLPALGAASVEQNFPQNPWMDVLISSLDYALCTSATVAANAARGESRDGMTALAAMIAAMRSMWATSQSALTSSRQGNGHSFYSFLKKLTPLMPRHRLGRAEYNDAYVAQIVKRAVQDAGAPEDLVAACTAIKAPDHAQTIVVAFIMAVLSHMGIITPASQMPSYVQYPAYPGASEHTVPPLESLIMGIIDGAVRSVRPGSAPDAQVYSAAQLDEGLVSLQKPLHDVLQEVETMCWAWQTYCQAARFTQVNGYDPTSTPGTPIMALLRLANAWTPQGPVGRVPAAGRDATQWFVARARAVAREAVAQGTATPFRPDLTRLLALQPMFQDAIAALNASRMVSYTSAADFVGQYVRYRERTIEGLAYAPIVVHPALIEGQRNPIAAEIADEGSSSGTIVARDEASTARYATSPITTFTMEHFSTIVRNLHGYDVGPVFYCALHNETKYALAACLSTSVSAEIFEPAETASQFGTFTGWFRYSFRTANYVKGYVGVYSPTSEVTGQAWIPEAAIALAADWAAPKAPTVLATLATIAAGQARFRIVGHTLAAARLAADLRPIQLTVGWSFRGVRSEALLSASTMHMLGYRMNYVSLQTPAAHSLFTDIASLAALVIEMMSGSTINGRLTRDGYDNITLGSYGSESLLAPMVQAVADALMSRTVTEAMFRWTKINVPIPANESDATEQLEARAAILKAVVAIGAQTVRRVQASDSFIIDNDDPLMKLLTMTLNSSLLRTLARTRILEARFTINPGV